MDYRDFTRNVSELPDGLTVAPILALCGRLLTPNDTLNFGGRKPLTIFNFVASRAGMRKSTTFLPAVQLARQILTPEDLIGGNASDSALFDTFEQQPHRLQFEDEGNAILRSWETQSFGREVSARCLGLYDGSPWHQNFLAANPGRLGALTASELYSEIIPHLVTRQQCMVTRSGKHTLYTLTWKRHTLPR